MDPPTRPPARVSVLRSLSQRTRKPDIQITSYDSSPAQEGQYTGGDTLTPVRSYVAGAEGYPSQNESKEKWIAQEEQEIAVRMSLDRQRSTHSSLHQSDSTVVPTGLENRDPAFEIDFTPEHDPRNPRCWPLWYKVFVIFTKSYSTTAVVLYSTAYTSSLDGIISYFGVTRIVATMGLTVFLLGMAVGSVVVAPLSEMYGRRPIYLISIVIFVVLLLPTALAHNYASILVPRLLSGIAASALVTNSPGTVNDLVNDKYRALAFSIWGESPCRSKRLVLTGYIAPVISYRCKSGLTYCSKYTSDICFPQPMNGPVVGKHTFTPVDAPPHLPFPRSHHRRLRLPIPGLALDILARPHLYRYRRHPHLLQQGDLRARDFAQGGGAEEERDGRSEVVVPV